MNKTKLIGLSLLAFSAVGVMASCSGGKPAEKPDVYFRATASILGKDGEETISKQTEYKDAECATVTFDKNLRYGAQDVVITIEPKQFFTFRKYDTETWAPIGAPARPYVGLGNPHTLYSYPLQERVAWTFNDLSTKTTEGFYKEKYQITVKKEFFQKNIVIDYGNVSSLNNDVYVYNSAFYDNAFKDSLSGEFSSLYEFASSASNFAAASKGATITYVMKHDDNLYNFYGWEAEPKKSNANDGEKLDYENFKIWGYTKDGKKENIAQFDPNPEVKEKDQLFKKPIISTDGKAITFTIDWHLLAENDADYTVKFEKIEVVLGAPNIGSNVTFDFEEAEGLKRYECDFFQYDDPDDLSKKKPFYNDGNLVSVDPDAAEERKLEFANVLLREKLEENESVKYSMLFEVPEADKEHFSVTVGNSASIEVDIAHPQNYTNWHKNTGQTGELELPYWNSGNWYLMQLNPYVLDDDGNPVNREYGLPDKFQNGGQNLYYLYTLESSDLIGGLSIKVAYIGEPKYAFFSLDSASSNYGTLTIDAQGAVSCVGKNEVYLGFKPNAASTYLNFDVTVTKETKNGNEETFVGKYIPGETRWSDSSIYIHSTDGTKFADKDKFTITLTEVASSVSLAGQTEKIGQFVVKTGEDEWTPIDSSRVITPEEIAGRQVTCHFQLFEDYKNAMGSGGTLSEDLNWKIKFNGVELSEGQLSVIDRDHHNRVIEIEMKNLADIKAQGDALDVTLSYVELEFNDNVFSGKLTIGRTTNYSNLGSYVGKKDNFNQAFIVKGPEPEKGSIVFSVQCERAGKLTVGIKVEEAGQDASLLSISFNFSSVGSIINGMKLIINADLGK